MHAQTTRSVEQIDADADRAILTMLLADPALWKTDEVLREMSNPLAAEDSLARLYAAGLIHRLEGFVFPTRAARCASALGE